jgi:hypothetical protein
MSTGLTFGTISALFGLLRGTIDQGKYSALVAAVIVSAVIPTVIANAFYLPRHLLPAKEVEEARRPIRTQSLPRPGESRRDVPMFSTILQANDGSEPAFEALRLAIALAKQNCSELHMVCVEEIEYMPGTHRRRAAGG